MKSLLRRRHSLSTELSFDNRGFLIATIENDGATEPDAAIDLRVPKDRDGQWIARVDDEGYPAMETGLMVVDEEGLVEGKPSLSWRESGLVLAGAKTTTTWRFFVGAVAEPSELRTTLRISGDHLGSTYEFSSLLLRTPPPPVE